MVDQASKGELTSHNNGSMVVECLRKARIDAPGALHYILLRGMAGKEIFQDEADRDNFVDRLAHLLKESSSSCYAWALMPTQIHLLLKTGESPISSLLHRLLTGYAVTFNNRHRRHGPLFHSRYSAILCQEAPYLLELVRYIHLHPLHLGVVRGFSELGRYRYPLDQDLREILGAERLAAQEKDLHERSERLILGIREKMAGNSDADEIDKAEIAMQNIRNMEKEQNADERKRIETLRKMIWRVYDIEIK